MNLKKNMEGYMGQFGGWEEKGRRKCNYTKSQSKKMCQYTSPSVLESVNWNYRYQNWHNKDKNIGPNRCLTL